VHKTTVELRRKWKQQIYKERVYHHWAQLLYLNLCINAEEADNKIKNTEPILGCIKNRIWLHWTKRRKKVLVLDKRKIHSWTLNANHLLSLNRRQIQYFYLQSWAREKKTALSCTEKCPFPTAICISETIKYTHQVPSCTISAKATASLCFVKHFCNNETTFLNIRDKLLVFFFSSPKQKALVERRVLQFYFDLSKQKTTWEHMIKQNRRLDFPIVKWRLS